MATYSIETITTEEAIDIGIDVAAYKGDQGLPGVRGNGIVAITKTSGTGEAGTDDEYTILFDDDWTTSFTVYNGSDGVGIVSIEKISGDSLSGETDVYAINLSNGNQTQLYIYNGKDGEKGATGNKGEKGEKGDPYGTDIRTATVTLSSSSHVYDGTEQTQTVESVILNGETLVENKDYYVLNNTAIDAGQHTLLVNGTLFYGGSIPVSWNISKAQSILVVDDTNVEINKSTSKYKIDYSLAGVAVLSASTSNSSVATVSISGDKIEINPVNAGTATITITATGNKNWTNTSATVNVTVLDGHCFGVEWDYSNSSTALIRQTEDTDPNGYVNTNVIGNPVPAIGSENGSSFFDNYLPWNGMTRHTINTIGNVVDFENYNENTVVFIPEFYCRVVNDVTHSKIRIYVSDAPMDNFTKHPGSGRYVSRYVLDGNYDSVTGSSPLTSIRRSEARSAIKAKGDWFYQYDYATYSAVYILYVVEYADWNSQLKIGYGNTATSNLSPIVSGGTDTMIYHTGRAIGTNNKSAVQYRWIENLWGNIIQWVDGINIFDKNVYVCTDPESYAENTSQGYQDTGIRLAGQNYITKLENNNSNWILIPSEANGSSSTYVPDYSYAENGWKACRVGGAWDNGDMAGLFYFSGSGDDNSISQKVGTRYIIIKGD